jgi:hypothetical protein
VLLVFQPYSSHLLCGYWSVNIRKQLKPESWPVPATGPQLVIGRCPEAQVAKEEKQSRKLEPSGSTRLQASTLFDVARR